MKNISIGKRLAMGFGLILILVTGLSIQIREILLGLDSDVKGVVTETMPKLRMANEIINIVDENAGSIRNLILADKEELIAKEIEQIAGQRSRIVAKYDSLQRVISTDVEKQAYEDVLTARKAFVPFQEGMMRLVENKDGTKARELLFGEYQEYQKNYMQAVGRLLAVEDSIARQRGIAAEKNVDAGVMMLMIASLFMIGLGAVIAFWITRSVVNPIRRCMDAASNIALGNMEMDCSHELVDKSETGQLSAAMSQMVQSIKKMVEDAKTLSQQIKQGRLLERVDLSGHQGEFKSVLAGLNQSIDAMAGFLDSIPAPAMIVNPKFEILYMNKAGVDLGGISSNVLVSEKKHCYDYFCTGDCKSDKCATARAMRSRQNVSSETVANVGGKSLDIQYTGVPIQDDSGNAIGSFEVITDLSAIKIAQRKATKIANYQEGEVNRMAKNLKAISEGILNCDFDLAPGDSDTHEIRQKFEGLSLSLHQSVQAIQGLARDVQDLAKQAVNGNLSSRANSGAHQGDFRVIVEGVNATLDAVLAPIHEASAVLEKVAQRDLTARVLGDYVGDHAKIKQALNEAVDNLEGALQQVRDGAIQVGSASQQISEGSQSLAQGANEQASSLEEISSSLEEISSMTKQNADNSILAKQLAAEADVNAQTGSSAMKRMSESIERIKAGSDATAKIIKTIDEIAMQTNLLALNAAVEAARAGEAGRGFAVVAEEVRNLAQRSAQAAKNTADMIGESVRNADDGVKISVEVSSSFGFIAESVSKVNGLIAEIASASKEQSQGLQQLSGAMSEMDKVTQQNAANAEESASASEELSSQSEELQAMVGQFKISIAAGLTVSSPKSAVPAPKIVHGQAHWHAGKSAPVKHKAHKMQKVRADEIIPLDNEELKEF